jgi:hypothetical protein
MCLCWSLPLTENGSRSCQVLHQTGLIAASGEVCAPGMSHHDGTTKLQRPLELHVVCPHIVVCPHTAPPDRTLFLIESGIDDYASIFAVKDDDAFDP